MIQLYRAADASDIFVVQGGRSLDETRAYFENASRLLTVRGDARAATLLSSGVFRVVHAMARSGDVFPVLLATVPAEEYEKFRLSQAEESERRSLGAVAETLAEVGLPVKYIGVEIALERPEHPDAQRRLGLTPLEVDRITSKYIGVSGGYLGDFSYATHREFYVDLNLDIDPNSYGGTTRQRFKKILSENPPEVQSQILEGVLSRFPVSSSPIRTPERAAEIEGWIRRLRAGPQVEQPTLRITSETVERALLDAQELIRTTGATSGVDRVHTALHGFLLAVCRDQKIAAPDGSSLTDLFKVIREQHPAFGDLGPRSEEIVRVVRTMAAIVDALNPLRNKASVAHPNENLLPEPEAMLVINAVRTILRYIDDKVHRHSGRSGTEAAP